MKQEFDLEGHSHIALCDLLKMAGLADSGGRAKQLISGGLVLRNGQVETRKTAKIISGDCICMDKHEVVVIDSMV